jgi:hypothetical protein
MSSFAGIEFKVQAVDSFKWQVPPRVQDSPRTWSGTIQVDTHAQFEDLAAWFCTVDSRRALRSLTWTHIVKAGPGKADLIVPASGSGEDNFVTYVGAILTRFDPKGDGWRFGRYFIDVEALLP